MTRSLFIAGWPSTPMGAPRRPVTDSHTVGHVVWVGWSELHVGCRTGPRRQWNRFIKRRLDTGVGGARHRYRARVRGRYTDRGKHREYRNTNSDDDGTGCRKRYVVPNVFFLPRVGRCLTGHWHHFVLREQRIVNRSVGGVAYGGAGRGRRQR